MISEQQPKYDIELQRPEKKSVLTTTEELLGKTPEEPGTLDIAKAPINLFSQRLGNGNILTEAHVDYPLGGFSFFKFLNEVAPLPNSYVGGIDADWRMPDMARGEKLYGRPNTRLLKMHANLGADWGDFEANRKHFLNLLNTDAAIVKYLAYVDGAIMEPTAYIRQLAISSTLKKTLNSQKRTPHSANYEDFRDNLTAINDEIIEYMRSNPQLWKEKQLKNPRINFSNAAIRRFWSMSRQTRLRFFENSKILNQLILDKSFIDKAVHNYLTESRNCVSFEDNEGDRVYLVRDETSGLSFKMPENELSEANILKVVNRYDSSEKTAELKKGRTGRYSVVDTNEEWLIRAKPLVVWETNPVTGKRRFLVRPNDINLQHQDNENGLIGLLLIPYLEPELRIDWPKQLFIEVKDKDGKIIKRYGPQMNGPAQVPVYALTQREQIAENSEFLKRAEELVASQA